jgi:hypothetical protein
MITGFVIFRETQLLTAIATGEDRVWTMTGSDNDLSELRHTASDLLVDAVKI